MIQIGQIDRYTPAMRRCYPALLAATFAVLHLAASCDEARQWRDSQVAQSHKIAQGSKVTPPATPIEVPDSVRDELPLDSSFTILSYSGPGNGGGSPPPQGDTVSLTAFSPWPAEQTALWLVARLGELGYDSGDNASRVLEGAEFHRDRGTYRTLYVKLGLNTAEQCTVEYRAGK
jgi:hypothetical protein